MMSEEDAPTPNGPTAAAEEVLCAAGEAPTPEEQSARHAGWLAERRRRAQDQTLRGRRSWAAMEGWGAVTTEEEWLAAQDRAAEDWFSGKAFIEMCGGERYLDPPRTALLFHLWHHFVQAYQPDGPAEYLCIAMALIGFNQLIRVNEFVGNLATRTENSFFGSEPLEVRVIKDESPWGYYDRMEAKAKGHDYLAQLGREALPLLDRCNRLVLRNLKMLRDLKTTPIAMTVQNFGQLNVGTQQTNTAQPPPTDAIEHAAEAGHEAARPRRKTPRRPRPAARDCDARE